VLPPKELLQAKLQEAIAKYEQENQIEDNPN
jgi:hypothetical protein